MYTIINRTNGSCLYFKGNFPAAFIEERLNNGEKIIVISSYSHTVKVPEKVDGEWVWEDYTYDPVIVE